MFLTGQTVVYRLVQCVGSEIEYPLGSVELCEQHNEEYTGALAGERSRGFGASELDIGTFVVLLLNGEQ